MRHSIEIEGPGVRLRPVTVDDAATIVELRATTRSRYLHPISPDVEAQRAYLRAYLDRDDDWYFVIERRQDARVEGLIGIYGVEPLGGVESLGAHGRQAEWGRWVVRDGSLAAPESVLLIHDVAFDHLGLDRLFCRTVADNASVVAFHDSCGAERAGVRPAHFTLDGTTYDAVEHGFTRAAWSERRPSLLTLVARIARRLAPAAA